MVMALVVMIIVATMLQTIEIACVAFQTDPTFGNKSLVHSSIRKKDQQDHRYTSSRAQKDRDKRNEEGQRARVERPDNQIRTKLNATSLIGFAIPEWTENVLYCVFSFKSARKVEWI